MKSLMRLNVLACTFIGLVLGFSSRAVEVSSEQAQLAVANWLRENPKAMTAEFKSGGGALSAKTFRDDGGTALFHVVELADGGYVVTSTDTELAPIAAFSAEGKFSAEEGNPLYALLRRDMAVHVRHVQTSGGKAKASSNLTAPLSRETSKWVWAALLGEARERSMSKAKYSIEDVRVDPMVQSRWDQDLMGGVDTFNYYTPNSYVCGCVATAFSQIMRFWCKPTGTVSAADYDCWVDNQPRTLSMKGGAYDWDSMPLKWTSSLTSPTKAQRQAIGKLTYDVGVASHMGYKSAAEGGSGTWGAITVKALKERFGYQYARSAGFDITQKNIDERAKNAIFASLDAGLPVAIGIFGNGGHEVVVDGYGFDGGSPYLHLNCGWSGSSDAWYNVAVGEYMGSFYFNNLSEVAYNIDPVTQGDVISGLVLDRSGHVVANAEVTLTAPSSKKMTTRSNARGIYFFRVTESGEYGISAVSAQCSGTANVTITRSDIDFMVERWQQGGTVYNTFYNDGKPVANRWGVDVKLTESSPSGKPDLYFAKPNSWPAAVYLAAESSQSSMEAVRTFTKGASIYLYASFGNRGEADIVTGYTIRHQVFNASGVEVASYPYSAQGEDLIPAGGDSRGWSGWCWEGLNGLEPGSYTYRCTLDSGKTVDESDESNNQFEYAFSVISPDTTSVTVTFNAMGGTVSPASRTYESGSAYGTLPTPEKSGYAFSGWFTSASAGVQVTETSVVPSQDTTLFAHWSEDTDDDTVNVPLMGGVVNSGVFSNPGFNWKFDLSGRPSWVTTVRFRYGVGMGNSLQVNSSTFNLSWSGDACFQITAEANTTGGDRSWPITILYGSSVVKTITFFQPGGSSTVTVTFDANGGTCATASYVYSVGASYGWLPVPSCSGKAFAGWFTASSGGSQVTVESSVSASVTRLFAHWQTAIGLAEALDNTDLKFSTGGDADWFGETEDASDGADAARSGTITDYETSWLATSVTGPGELSFSWMTSSEEDYDDLSLVVDGETVTSISGVTDWQRYSYRMPGGRHEVRWVYSKDVNGAYGSDCGWVDQVRWTASVDVTFDAQGGTVFPPSQSYVVGSEYGSLPTPEYEGHEFDGWYTAPSGGTRIFASSVVSVAYPVLYARWSSVGETVTVSFRPNGDGASIDGNATREYTVGKIYGSLPTAKRKDYSLLGWYTDSSGGVRVYEDSVVSKDCTTLWAHWSPIQIDEDEYGPWGTLDDVDSSDGGKPTTIRQMLVTIKGEKALPGDCVAVIRGDTGTICGLGKVRDVSGTVTIVMYVAKGVPLHFKVWVAASGEELDGDASCDLLSPAQGEALTGLELTVSGEHVLELSLVGAKWHQVSFNVLPEDPTPASVFGPVAEDIEFVTTGDMRYWDPMAGDGTISSIAIGTGYWVQTKKDSTVWAVVGKPDASAPITLKRGWNLIGYNPLESGSVASVLATALKTGYIDMIVHGNAFYPDTLSTMRPGEGYYVYASQPCTIVYDSGKSLDLKSGDTEEDEFGPWGTLDDVDSSDGGKPTVIRQMAVTVDGDPAQAGDCVAVFRRDTGALCGLGRVGEDGLTTIVMYIVKNVALDFKVWVAGGETVYDAVPSFEVVTPAQGESITDLILDVSTTAGQDVIVTFDPAGGVLDIDWLEYEVGKEYGEFPQPVRTGYVFGGWYTDSGVRIRESSIVDPAIASLVAVWTPNAYRVSFNANGGAGMMNDQEFTYDTAARLQPCQFALAGHAFAGWSLEKDGEKAFDDGDEVKNLTDVLNHTVTLFALWTELPPQTYTIVYLPGCEDAEGNMDPQTVTAGAFVKLTPNAFVRAGHNFVGWAREEGGEAEFNDGAFVSALGASGETVRLYAVWQAVAPMPTETVKVTFHSNDPRDITIVKEFEKYTYYGTFPDIGTFGPYFAGWYTEPDGGMRVTERSFVSPTYRDLYAVWLYTEGDAYFAVTPKESNATKNPKEITDEAIEWSIDKKHWFAVDGTPIEVKPGSYTMTFRSRDKRWLAPAAQKVKAVRDKVVGVSPVATRVNLVRIDKLYGTGASGKVSKSLVQVKKGKTVTLKATPGKNCVLACWRNAETDTVLGTANSLKLKPSMDMNVVAEFRKKSSYSSLGKPQQYIDDWELEALELGACGDKFSFRVEVDEEQWPVSFSASGLPPGLKINTATGVISGSPTKPGSYTIKVKVKSKVNPKKYTVVSYKVKVAWHDEAVPVGNEYGPCYIGTRVDELFAGQFDDLPPNCTASGLPSGLKFSKGRLIGAPTKVGTFTAIFSSKLGSKTRKSSTVFKVVALPSWAKGTFAGGADAAKLSMSVSSAGKISGSLMKDGSTWTLSASSFTLGFDDYLECSNVVAKCGTRKMPIAFTVSPKEIAAVDGKQYVRGIVMMEAGVDGASGWIDAWQSPWGLSAYKTFAGKYLKNRTLTISGERYGFGTGERISLKFSNTGSVVATGRFAVGVTKGKTVYYAPSSSSVVAASSAPDASFRALVFIYFAPQKSKSFAGYACCVEVCLVDGKLAVVE